VDFSYRTFDRHGIEHDEVENNVGAVTSDYLRLRYDPEREGNVQSKSTYEHKFDHDQQDLTFELRAEHHTETENNHYTDLFTTPAGPPIAEFIRVATNEPGTEATADYINDLSKDARLELGFDRSEDQSYQDHLDLLQDPVTGLMVSNPQVTNSFDLDQTVTAFYATLRRTWGGFGALLGGRAEEAQIDTNQVTSAIVNDQRYFRLYPSLHLTYDLTETQQLQLNYSHRVRRPDTDDLNPYPRYQDPYNLTAGNPYLKPEEVHSIEAGYQYKTDDTTYLATLYYKAAYNTFTQVSQYISSTVLLTTQENLGQSQSGGVEFAATTAPIKRLTPQGYREPTFVANTGFKHEFKNKKFSAVFTVADLFNSLKEETKLNTPVLQDDSTRRRSSRIFSVGLIYNFGSSKAKGPKSDSLQFE